MAAGIGFDRRQSVEQIIRELGITITPDEIGVVYSLWDSYADKAVLFPRLQYLYTKRQAVDWLRGGRWQEVTFAQGGVQRSASDRFAHLSAMYDALTGEITVLLSSAQMAQGAVAGQIAAREPVTPCWPGQRDANDPLYSGSPYRRWPFIWPW